MNRTFETEDARKTKLFDAWISYLRKLHTESLHDEDFIEFYEGSASVSDLSKNRIGLHLEDGRKLRHIPISPEISAQSCRLDVMYVVLGRRQGEWWPLDVISVGTVLGRDRVHITYNPLYVFNEDQPEVVH